VTELYDGLRKWKVNERTRNQMGHQRFIIVVPDHPRSERWSLGQSLPLAAQISFENM